MDLQLLRLQVVPKNPSRTSLLAGVQIASWADHRHRYYQHTAKTWLTLSTRLSPVAACAARSYSWQSQRR